MGVTYIVRYHVAVVANDLPTLSSYWAHKIKLAIEKKLTARPEVYGKPLRGSLKGYWKLRAGDYRVVYRIEKASVKIFAIRHRTAIYGVVEKRLHK